MGLGNGGAGLEPESSGKKGEEKNGVRAGVGRDAGVWGWIGGRGEAGDWAKLWGRCGGLGSASIEGKTGDVVLGEGRAKARVEVGGGLARWEAIRN